MAVTILLANGEGDQVVTLARFLVTVDNISITANYRNQFNRVINDQGLDALMNEMRSKQQELLASLGK